MRYIFRNTDGDEKFISLNNIEKIDENIQKINIDNKEFFVRKLGGNYFLSQDLMTWKKIAKLNSNDEAVFNEQVFKVFRGYKPSGVGDINPGSLITQMPGKVVKLMTKVGDAVVKGQTLLILEAMKMENEIKAGMDGKVKLINVKEGQALESGQMMIELE